MTRDDPRRRTSDAAPEAPPTEDKQTERNFRPWRLLAVLGGVIVVLALIAAAVDIYVLGF